LLEIIIHLSQERFLQGRLSIPTEANSA